MGVRERLDSLTVNLWAQVDKFLDQTDPDPDADSIAASNINIDETNALIGLIVTGVDDPLDKLNAQISAITAIAGPSRTQEQKDMLDLLRIVKAMHLTNVKQYRQIVDLQRRVKTLQRAVSIVGRFAMFLDGGPNRVRQEDLDGNE